MIKATRRSILKTSATCVAISSIPELSRAQAAFVPPSYQPDDLKTVLTPFGSTKAGNADGSIPAWTGEGYPMPAGYISGDQRPIPFAEEKPLFTITAANVQQYADKLSAGQQALFVKYPDFSMQIYPSHRTAIAPQYVYDNIYQNATSAQLSPDGNSVIGAYGGIAFPFPKTGLEVIWNHLLVWAGTTKYFVGQAHTVTASGQIVLETTANSWEQFPYYLENGKDSWNGTYFQLFVNPTAPPYEAGASIVQIVPVNLQKTDVAAWEYLLGQRRVRRAPELQFDTPNSLTGGTSNWDESNILQGKVEQYDYNYVGVKEFYVPYNTNKFNYAPVAQQFQTHFLNPDLVRWELHRCRVVEMTLKPGARNVDTRRIMYCDEDTGGVVLADVYDGSGALWKFLHNLPALYSDVPCLLTFGSYATFDLHSGEYALAAHYSAECPIQEKVIPELPDSFFSPGHLAAAAGGY